MIKAKYDKQEVREAAARVAHCLEKGFYKHVVEDHHIEKGTFGFDMNICAIQAKDCGTVCCIGGWMGFELGGSNPHEATCIMNTIAEEHRGLHNLFYNYPDSRSKTKPEEAAKAIKRWLNGNTNPWKPKKGLVV